MKKITTLLVLSLSFIGVQTAFAAAPTSPVTGDIAVSLTIEAGCAVTPESSANQVTANAQNWANLNFGSEVGGSRTALTTSGGFDIECSQGANPSLSFGKGNNPDTTKKTRDMSDGKDKLSYALYESDGKTPVPTLTPQKDVPNGVYTIVAKTTPQPGIPAGVYTDTVTATLTW